MTTPTKLNYKASAGTPEWKTKLALLDLERVQDRRNVQATASTTQVRLLPTQQLVLLPRAVSLALARTELDRTCLCNAHSGAVRLQRAEPVTESLVRAKLHAQLCAEFRHEPVDDLAVYDVDQQLQEGILQVSISGEEGEDTEGVAVEVAWVGGAGRVP